MGFGSSYMMHAPDVVYRTQPNKKTSPVLAKRAKAEHVRTTARAHHAAAPAPVPLCVPLPAPRSRRCVALPSLRASRHPSA